MAERVRIAILAGILLAGVAAWGQEFRGSLAGTVEDTSGARVPKARVVLTQPGTAFERIATTDAGGEFRFTALAPGNYRVSVDAAGFAPAVLEANVQVSSAASVRFTLQPQPVKEEVRVEGQGASMASQPIDLSASVQKTVITSQDLGEIPLAARSFANVAYLSPMTEPVEPSDPTKARITAVSFGGSSGLNVDLSVDGGDNNDDWIGGFLQNYSPDALDQFVVRTAQFDADTSRTNGGSVILSTKRGTDVWHGLGALYFRDTALNARNVLDNPEPAPKQPFGRQNFVFNLGGPIVREKLWVFGSFEYVRENASIAYSAFNQGEFQALAQLAGLGLVPGVPSIAVPTSVPVPFRDALFNSRLDWQQSPRTQWFLRGSLERNHTGNNLLQQGALPSTGANTSTDYWSLLVGQTHQFSNTWVGALTLQANSLHLDQARTSTLGFAYSFPFSISFLTTSAFETFGDQQFVTPITAFPVLRDQQKYQARYDVTHAGGRHTIKFGVNFVHEPVLAGALSASAEKLYQFPQDPSFYLANPAAFAAISLCDPSLGPCPDSTFTPAGDGRFAQNVQRLGLYLQDSWRVRPSLTLNYGLRYDTTWGLFRASGRLQDQNPALLTLAALGIPLVSGIPHDYRAAFAPRLGFAWSPGQAGSTVVRGGIGLYYNDLAQNGWVDAFTAVNAPPLPCQVVLPVEDPGCIPPGGQGALVDPNYKTPYALQVSFGVERALSRDWKLNVFYEHQEGVHQYRRYEYAGGVTLNSAAFPGMEPNLSLFKTDNRSRYDGMTVMVQHRLSHRFELTAHYTLASAATWGAVVGELFDYVNGVSDVRNPFGPGDYGPSGEDVRHRFVLAGVLQLPYRFELSTLAQVESARPFTIGTPVDVNGDGIDFNDRAVVNGVQTTLDQFRGRGFLQADLRLSRDFEFARERVHLRTFVEFFNLLNRANPGNNYAGDVSALPLPVNDPANVTAFCLNPACTLTQPVTNPNQLRFPAGALGDFFGPGTTVGIPFAAQFGARLTF
jgi:hypothetical protein